MYKAVWHPEFAGTKLDSCSEPLEMLTKQQSQTKFVLYKKLEYVLAPSNQHLVTYLRLEANNKAENCFHTPPLSGNTCLF